MKKVKIIVMMMSICIGCLAEIQYEPYQEKYSFGIKTESVKEVSEYVSFFCLMNNGLNDVRVTLNHSNGGELESNTLVKPFVKYPPVMYLGTIALFGIVNAYVFDAFETVKKKYPNNTPDEGLCVVRMFLLSTMNLVEIGATSSWASSTADYAWRIDYTFVFN